MTSKGVVKPAANAPANAPEVQWVIGSYPLSGFITFDKDSYAVNCRAVNGTVMQRVVGYET